MYFVPSDGSPVCTAPEEYHVLYFTAMIGGLSMDNLRFHVSAFIWSYLAYTKLCLPVTVTWLTLLSYST